MKVLIYGYVRQFEKELKDFDGSQVYKIQATCQNLHEKRLEELIKIKKIEVLRVFKMGNKKIALYEIRIGKKSMNFRVFACGVIEENGIKLRELKLILLKVIYKKSQRLRDNDIKTSVRRCKQKLEEVFNEQ